MGHLLPSLVNARVQTTMCLVNYVVEADLIYDVAVRQLCQSFTLGTAFLSALFAATDSAGLDFTQVTGATIELAAYHAKAQFRACCRRMFARFLWRIFLHRRLVLPLFHRYGPPYA